MTQKEFKEVSGDYTKALTLERVCELFSMSENTLKNSFPRSQKSILKKYGRNLIKVGRGATAKYYLSIGNDIEDPEYPNEDFNAQLESLGDLFVAADNSPRATTMYAEDRTTVGVGTKEFQALISWDLLVILGISMTPMRVFRGTHAEFLKYCDVTNSRYNIQKLKESIAALKEKDVIMYEVDETDETEDDYFILCMFKQSEKEMQIGVNMIYACKVLGDKHNLKNWSALLKTWIGIELMAKEQPYTQDDLSKMTGLSKYIVRQSISILEESNIFKTSKAYLGLHCLGTNVDMNVEAFYEI